MMPGITMSKTKREISKALYKSRQTMQMLARTVSRDEGGLSAMRRLRTAIDETERQSVRYQDFLALQAEQLEQKGEMNHGKESS